MRIIVGRHINGIVLNGLEYLTGINGDLMEFSSIEKATEYLLENGCDEEDLDYFIFKDLKGIDHE